MNIKLTLSGIIVFLCACNSGTINSDAKQLVKYFKVSEDSLFLNKTKGIFQYKNEPFNGSSVQKYSNQQIARSIDYVDGKKHGLLKMWFENGQISYQANYKKGKLDGAIKSWWKNGTQRSESYYEKGKVHGTQKQWYQSGAKFKVLNFKHGLEEGMQTAWRENGKIYNNYEAKNGRIFGLKRANLCYSLDNETIQYKD